MQKTIDQQRYVNFSGRIIIITVAMVLLPITFCSPTLACIKVHEVSIYAGKSQEEANNHEYDGEIMYIPIDSRAYFRAEIDDVCNPDNNDFVWDFDFDSDSIWDYNDITYWLYCIPYPPNPWTYDTEGWYYPKVKAGLKGVPDSDAEDTCQVGVVTVTNVAWQTCPGNTPLAGGKIFPGKKVYCDLHGPDRRKVFVKATLNMEPEASDNIYVRFKCWDVDDPCFSTAPVDPHDNDPDPNKHSMDNEGSFYFEDTGHSVDVLAESGLVHAIFNVSMRPGDNYRITATTSQEANDDLTHYKVETGNLPSSVKRTPILTTWRKLWIERDSMDAIADTGEEKNYVSGTASLYELISFPPAESHVYLGQNLPGELDDEEQFYPGRYHASNNLTYTVFYSSGYLFGEDYLRVAGDPNGDNADMDYDLFDDDYHTATLQPYVTLPTYPDLGSYTNEFRRAYIEPVYLPPCFSNVVSFNRNLSYVEIEFGQGDWNDHFNNPPSSGFWSVLSVTSFQPRCSHDGDPYEELWLGESHPSRNDLALYLEVIREAYSDVRKTMAHEIGHTGGLDECESSICIMKDGNQFCDYCLDDMRKNGSTW